MPTKASAVNLSALIEEVAEIFRSQSQFEGSSSIELDLDPKVIMMADPDQLKAVVWNLWNNVMESMKQGSGPEAGCPSARVLSAPKDAAQAQRGLGRKGGGGGSASGGSARGHAVLEIEDTGCGIPEAVQEQIFEPFYTTKRDGTGLGLATVQRLVEQQGGSIQVSSLEGVGTTFRVRLMLAEGDHGIA